MTKTSEKNQTLARGVLTGIALLATATAWAAPPSGAKSNNHLLIVGALADFGADALYIVGQGFDAGRSLSVGLGATGDISSLCAADLGASPQVITCDFSLEGMPSAGDYLLTVATGGGASQYDEYDLTIGAVGSQGEPGPIGPQGEQGIVGPQGEQGISGPQGEQGPTGPQGPIGITGPAGPSGPQGPAGEDGDGGLSGYQVIRQNAQNSFAANGFFVQTLQCPEGKVVMSGGYGHNGWTNNFQVLAAFSGPSPNTSNFNTSETSWTVGWKNYESFPLDLNVAIWIVCVDEGSGGVEF